MKISSLSFILAGLFLFYGLLLPDNSFAQTGSLRVVISPEEARDAGAQWRRVGESQWLDSGFTETNLATGNHQVEFRTVEGWTAPRNTWVFIRAGEDLVLPVSYSQRTGSVTITLRPQEVRDAGARWKIEGQTDWLESGATASNIPDGTYDIDFSDVDGWEKPTNQSVTIRPGYIRYLTYDYQSVLGSLEVVIEPESARLEGAQWRIVGVSDWFESGHSESNIIAGDYQVEFRDIEGWNTPPSRSVTIRGDETARLNVTYVQQTGGLTVIINPLEARDAGAQWRITGTDQWYGSGDTILDIEAGEHVIEFARVPGWLRPANQIVTIIGDETIVLSVTYQQGGDLQVFLEPLEAREAGAGWRLAGIVPDLEKFPSGWYDEDLVTIFGLRPGIYTMEFNAIPGWIKPENITVRITAGSTTFQSARYVISTETGSLRVFIEPAPAAFLGARWRRVGTDVWLHSGDLEKGFPEGTYTVEFKPVPGWAPPGNKAVSIHRGDPPSNMTGYYQSPQPGVRIMNWLESVYPALLPLSNLHVQQTDGWYIRYYPDSDAYLGSKGGRLYYYAPQIEDVIHDLGLEDSWIPHARESGF